MSELIQNYLEVHQPTKIDTTDELLDYCQNCNKENPTKIEILEEKYTVRGDDIEISSNVRVCCICNTPIFDEELDTVNINRAYEKYRLKHDYLSSEDIQLIREKYGLSQRGLAKLLTWSPSTVARYETGAIPSPSHHSMLVTLNENIEYTKDLYRKNKHTLSRLDQQRMEKRISEYERGISEVDIIQLFSKKQKSLGDPIYKGFVEFDFNKFFNIVLFFCKKLPNVSKTKLMKLLFYADFKNYKEYGLSISGIAYQHLPYGPVPHHHWLMLDALTESKTLDLKPFQNFEGEYFEVLEDPDLSLFDEEELETLIEVSLYFLDFNAKKISDYSHEEEAYKQTKDREFISYDWADKLREFV